MWRSSIARSSCQRHTKRYNQHVCMLSRGQNLQCTPVRSASNQTIGQSINSSISQSINRSIRHSVYQPVNVHQIALRSLFGFSAAPAAPVRQTIRREVPFPRASMFDVVIDVQSYRSFLPFCTDSKIVKKSKANGSNQQTMDEMIAELSIGFRIFTEKYTSRVTSIQDQYIHIEAIQSSIFDHLISEWKFTPVPPTQSSGYSEHCMVEFTIDFLATSPIHASAVKMFFTDVTNKQLSAFIERCRVIDQQRRTQQRTVNQPIQQSTRQSAPAVDTQQPATQRVEQPSVQSKPIKQSTTQSVDQSSKQPSKQSIKQSTMSSPVAESIAAETGTHLPPPVFDTLHVKQPVEQTSDVQSTQTSHSAALELDQAVKPDQSIKPDQQTKSDQTIKSESTKRAIKKSLKDVFCPVEVRLSQFEFEQIRAVFHQFAVPAMNQATISQSTNLETSSPSLDQMIEESSADALSSANPTNDQEPPFPHVHNGHYVDTYASSPLVLNFVGFQSACAVLAAPNKKAVDQSLYQSTSRPISQHIKLPVFAKFRERANLRACAENAEIARAEFAQDPSLYQSSPSAGTDSDEYHAISQSMSQSNINQNKDFPPISFGRFVEIVHLLSRATVEDRLKYTLMRAALAEQAVQSPSISNTKFEDLTLSVSSLRFHTSSFFDVQLGMIRQVMPAMVIKRARELQSDEQVSSNQSLDQSNDAARMLTDNDADRGVYLLAMIGLMESVLYEIDGAIQDAMRVHSQDILSANQVGARVDDSTVHVNVSEWLSWWQSQAELLSVMSVPGMSSLIQWASATKGTNHMHSMKAQKQQK